MALELVAATANPNKLVEISQILGDLVDLLPRPDEVRAFCPFVPGYFY